MILNKENEQEINRVTCKKNIISIKHIFYFTKSKDGCEESIEDFQGEGNCAGLVIMLNGHGHHIEEDQDEDGNFKSVGKDNVQ